MSSAIQYEDDREEQWDDTDEETPALPGRPRRQFFNRWTAALLALITCAIGFYVGIRVEKNQVSSSSTAGGGFTPPTGLAGSGAASSTRGTSSTAGSARSSGSGFAGGGAGFPGGAFGGANASIGTISSVNGNTIYITDASGNTVKVTLSSATKIMKSLGVSKHSLRPGDSVVIRGLKNSNGKVSATTISDSGASNTGSGASGGSGSSGSSGSSGNSAVNQLFGQ
ncbi:MAG: DUF5666 domain-containing protein [Solirubrobacteraceae bacterium]